jgi:hypothetical protein
MAYEVLYEYGKSPLKVAEILRIGEKYVSSRGDVFLYQKTQDLEMVQDTPLSPDLDNNCMENLSDIQLNLFWTLCNNRSV